MNYLKSDDREEVIKNHESIVQALTKVSEECNKKIQELNESRRDKSAEIYNQEKKIRASKIILSVMDLAKLMDDKFPECRLEFDDIEFFNDKFDDKLIKNIQHYFTFLTKIL